MKEITVVSLGLGCATAATVRQWTGCSTAYTFDWIISSATSVAWCLADKFRRFFRGLRPHNDFCLIDGYGHYYCHDWYETLRHNPTFTPDDLVRNFVEKYTFVNNRFLSLLESSQTVLFVRAGGHVGEEIVLISAIEDTYPDLDFHLLLTDVYQNTCHRPTDAYFAHPRLIRRDVLTEATLSEVWTTIQLRGDKP